MGQWTKITGLNIALLFLVVYSLRSDVGVKGDENIPTGGGGGRRRSTTISTSTTAPPSFSSGASTFSSPPFSSPSPVWRRRPVHRRQHLNASSTVATTSTTTEPSSGPLLDQLPDDFINLASNSAGDFTSPSEPLPLTSSFYPTTGTGQKIYADPFMLSGDDNILGPTPSEPRRKVFRRTRRRRIKKLRAGGSSSTTSASYPTGTAEEDGEATGEDYLSSTTASASTEILNKFKLMTSTTSTTSTLRPTQKMGSTTTMRLAVVPIDSLMGQTEEVSTEGNPSPLFMPTTTGPTAMNNLRPGFYTPKQNQARKRAKSKENLWKASSPNFSVELFDNTDATDEQLNSNLDKRESSSKNTASASAANQVFAVPLPKPTGLTALLSEGDQSTGESIQNPYVNNTSLPISTELQNSLQFTLQVLHPLLNSDSVLTEKEPKIPENKTVAITHSLAESPAETPIAPDLRFLPAHLRKSHPLLSQEIFFDGGGGGGALGGKKVGNRFNVQQPGLHSIRNYGDQEKKISTSTVIPSTSSTSTSTTTQRTMPSSTSTQPSTTTSRRTTPYTTTTTVRIPSTSTIKAYSSSNTPAPPPSNVHLEGLGNLRITEIVYPTNAAPKESNPVNLKGYVGTPPRVSSTTGATTSTSSTTSKTYPSTTTGFTTSTAKSTPITTTQRVSSSSIPPPRLPSSGRPTPIFDHVESKSPPLILMGSDSMSSAVESPPAFDDMLLEELIKGFEPPKPSTTTTTTKTTTTTTTTPKPTTTTTRPSTTTTPPPRPPPPKLTTTPDAETQQLFNLLNLLQGQQNQPVSTSSTTETIKLPSSTSSSTTTLNPTNPKLDDEFLKQLALLETLLSPTAKTMIKEAVDTGTTEKIKNSAATQPGLTNSDLHQIFQLLDAMSTTSAPPTTTTTTPKPQIMHPALQNMLNLLTNPQGQASAIQPQKPLFTIPEPPKPVPTSSSFDLLSQLFNLNAAATTQKPPSVAGTFASGLTGLGGALGGLFDSFLPKKTPTNRDAGAGGIASASTNPLLSFFQTPSEPVVTPAPGPYFWFDVNAFLGQDPNAGPMSGIRPKFGNRDYFLKVRRRRNSMEMY